MAVASAHFAALCLSRPGAEEGAHQSGPDFQVKGEIFASLPAADQGSLKLTPEQQALVMELSPAFSPASVAWGETGWTKVNLGAVEIELLADFITAAWRNVAPKAFAALADLQMKGEA